MPIHPFSGGLGAVIDAKTGKLGYVDRQGNYAVGSAVYVLPSARPACPPVYAFSGFSNGFAWVKDGAEEGLIDGKGVFLMRGKYTQPKPDTLSGSPYRQSFGNGLCPVQDRTNGQAFYVDTTGKKAVALPAGSIGLPFRDGVAWVKLPEAASTNSSTRPAPCSPTCTPPRSGLLPKGWPWCSGRRRPSGCSSTTKVPEGSYVYLDKKGDQPFGLKFHVLTDPGYSFLNGDFTAALPVCCWRAPDLH
jgi:hypothetical protein